VRRATGAHGPYPFQRRIADDGLPELLQAPTGSGKTLAVVLPWLYRRRAHPQQSVRDDTPRWLILALPLRTLVDQVGDEVATWLQNLGLHDDVGLHVLMGGRPNANGWRDTPARDAVLIGSIDMLLSRALNRGYAVGRRTWPIDFGMLNNGAHWVFDEVQLLGPALPTSRQLQAFREQIGTMLTTRSTWMSATVAESWLQTIDNPTITTRIGIGDDDRRHPALAARLAATKTVRRLPIPGDKADAKALGPAIAALHRPGTRTLVFVNTVKLAQQLATALTDLADAPVHLVHSRFRPPDRAAALQRALDEPCADGPGVIVVTTQALEAGVDISSATLVTQTAPWSSIVQRAGRCNRAGNDVDATLNWFHHDNALPYEAADVLAARDALVGLEGQSLTGQDLVSTGVSEIEAIHDVLRRKDLIELFDTSPDLSGNDIDVSPYIRDAEERNVYVAWRDGIEADEVSLLPTADELCPAPLAEVRKWMAPHSLLRRDAETGMWTRTKPRELFPGHVLLANSDAGGYTPERGWDTSLKGRVEELPADEDGRLGEDAVTDEPLSFDRAWVSLADHLHDTGMRAESLLVDLGLDRHPAAPAMVRAAELHDIGKVHESFQIMLRSSAGPEDRVTSGVVWAKSSRARRVRNERPGFRHELLSALLLTTPQGEGLMGDVDHDLVRYLVAAHHGHVRLGLRAVAVDRTTDQRTEVLGVRDDDVFPEVEISPGTRVGGGPFDIGALAAFGGSGSWTRTALGLRDDAAIGVFRLGFMEALVRLADWAASRNPGTVRHPDGRVMVDA